ncbi:MAG: hypothetical protein KGO96_07780 [Elusimicrobia bacterium]|nr:hypothetical protein [Elusimicrobiota bacterium]
MTLEQLIAKHEGKEPNIYHDSLGIPTIGIGHNIKASPLPEGFNPPLSDDQIDTLKNKNNSLTPCTLEYLRIKNDSLKYTTTKGSRRTHKI